MTEVKQVAEEILRQIGGNQFRAMTGAKDFLALPEQRGALAFALPRMTGVKVTKVKVTLTEADLYRVVFFGGRGVNIKPIQVVEDVFAEDLRGVFESATGLRTSLTAIYGRAA